MIFPASKPRVLRKALLMLAAPAMVMAVAAPVGTTPAEASPSVPSAPTNVNASAGNTDASLTWTAAAGNGSAVTSYVITPYVGATAETTTTVACSGTPGACAGPTVQATVFGLTNGTSYTFTVTATNGTGSGPASSQTSSVTPYVATGAWRVTQTITGLSDPWGVAVDHSTGTLYVTNWDSPGTVSVLGAATGVVVATVDVGNDPQGVAVDPTTGKVYVANYGSQTVSYFSGATCNASSTSGCPTTASTIAVQNGPWDLSVDPSTGTVYVANNGGNSVSVISEATETVVATVDVVQGSSSRPEMAEVDPTTDEVYVANYHGGGVSVIDGGTCNASTQTDCSATLPAGLATVSDGPVTVAADPSTGLAYVPNAPGGVSSSSTLNDNTVSVLDEATGTVLANISSGSFDFTDYEEAVAVQATDTVVVTNGNSDTVTLIDGATSTVASRITVGSCPLGVAADQTAGLVYVANFCSDSVSVLSPPSPGDPTSLVATASDQSATVSFTAPASDDGSAISSYVVTPYAGAIAQAAQSFTCGSASDDIDCSSGATDGISATVTGLTDGTAYRFTVAAVNSTSTGQASSPSGEVTPGLSPSAPAGALASSAGQSATATVSWTAPSSDGGVPITSYSVTPYLDGTTVGTTSSFTCGSAPTDMDCSSAATDGLTAQVTGLVNGGSYSFTVQATNAVGTSTASAASNEVTVGIPDPPQTLTATASDIVTLSWSLPVSVGASALQGYDVYEGTSPGSEDYASPVNGPAPAPQSATSYDVTGLTAGKSYYFTVEAVNSLGSSPPSNEVTATPGAPASTTTASTTTTSTTTTSTATTVPPSGNVPPLVVGTTTTTTTPPNRTAPPPGFPGAGESYPNGAIVRFGTSDYVFAGGRAFSVPEADFGPLQGVDHAVVVDAATGAKAPTGVLPRPGTLVTAYRVDHDPTIYVEGADGELHGFASLDQFLSEGFDPALVVMVPGLGNAPVSTSSAGAAHVTALSVRADGAMAVSGGTYYVFAGGRAFGISSPAVLARLRRADTAEPLVGTVTPAEIGASVATGMLLSVRGEGVYLEYQGVLFRFKTTAQLAAYGYAGTAAVPVPGREALPVVYPYWGS